MCPMSAALAVRPGLFANGPWKVNQKQPAPDVVEVADESGIILIAQTFGVHAPARAKLIAAAPEMASMLLSMFVHVSHGGPTRAEAEALLKKAGVLVDGAA